MHCKLYKIILYFYKDNAANNRITSTKMRLDDINPIALIGQGQKFPYNSVTTSPHLLSGEFSMGTNFHWLVLPAYSITGGQMIFTWNNNLKENSSINPICKKYGSHNNRQQKNDLMFRF